MKFESKEEIKNKFRNDDGSMIDIGAKDWYSGYGFGVENAFKSFAKRKKFYEDYCDNHWALKEEQHEAWKEFIEYRRSKTLYQRGEVSLNSDWKAWLFNLCFGDV